jgi:UDP-GlcNAc:undecaprenyl-phosphate GlcNAc-1-phosphate transferase
MNTELYMTSFISLVGSFLLVIWLIPKIRHIVESRKLIDNPNNRSSHAISTPTMAGISFFLTLILALNFIKKWDIDGVVLNFITSLTIIFALGLKDDLMISTAKAKIGGEIIAVFCILFCSGLQFTSLEGFLGIYEIPSVVSYVFITVMILAIINSYNLIDGIDGLAAIIGIIIASNFGLIFMIAGLHLFSILSICMVGILSAYLRYNLSKTKKIFMGDTGSLIIGFCIGFLSLKFLSLDASHLTAFSFKPENKLLVVISLLYLPFLDMARVIGIRLINKKNPFSPDRNHMHHVLINSGLSHIKASLFLGFLSLFMSLLFISLSNYFNSFLMLVIFTLSSLLLVAIFDRLKSNVKSVNKFSHLVKAIQFLF